MCRQKENIFTVYTQLFGKADSVCPASRYLVRPLIVYILGEAENAADLHR